MVFVSNNYTDLNRKPGKLGTMLPLFIGPLRLSAISLLRSYFLQTQLGVNVVDCTGSIPLHHARAAAKEVLVRQLLPATVHVDARNDDGETPLLLLLRISPGTDITPLVSLFINAGQVNVDRADRIGLIPLHYACAAANEALIRQTPRLQNLLTPEMRMARHLSRSSALLEQI